MSGLSRKMKMEELADITKELRDARRDDKCGWMS